MQELSVHNNTSSMFYKESFQNTVKEQFCSDTVGNNTYSRHLLQYCKMIYMMIYIVIMLLEQFITVGEGDFVYNA